MFRRLAEAQAMVEFALALPILLLVLYGLIEVGRVIFIYSTVITASREAVRYGSAYGVNGVSATSVPVYEDCAGIRNAAKKVGFLLNLQDSNIVISYDQGLDASGIPINWQEGCPPAFSVASGDRINVAVTYDYSPILTFVPLTSKTVSSSASRTIMGDIDLSVTESPH